MSNLINQPAPGPNQGCASNTIYYNTDGAPEVQINLENPNNFIRYSSCGIVAQVCNGGGLKVDDNGCLRTDICVDTDEFVSGTVNPTQPLVTAANSPRYFGGAGPLGSDTTLCIENCCGTPMKVVEWRNALLDIIFGPDADGAQYTIVMERRCSTGTSIAAASAGLGAAPWGQFSDFVADRYRAEQTPITGHWSNPHTADTVNLAPGQVRCCQYRVRVNVQAGSLSINRFNINAVHLGVGQGASC